MQFDIGGINVIKADEAARLMLANSHHVDGDISDIEDNIKEASFCGEGAYTYYFTADTAKCNSAIEHIISILENNGYRVNLMESKIAGPSIEIIWDPEYKRPVEVEKEDVPKTEHPLGFWECLWKLLTGKE